MEDSEKIEIISRHIEHVRESCHILGNRLMELGENAMGLQLIMNGEKHDNSKYTGIEWLYLHEDIKEIEPEKFKLAVIQHVTTNPHHPEYWGDISEVPRVYLAEAVVDWKARSSEFGTDLREWIIHKATKKFKISTSSRVYKQIKDFLDLLLERKFNDTNLLVKAQRNGTILNGKNIQEKG